MSSFEIQVYKSGIWNVDSYFDDRDMAISEAEGINESGRHSGVRVMQENFDENTNTSNYRVLFSKTQSMDQGRGKSSQTKRSPATKNAAATKTATKNAAAAKTATKDSKDRPSRTRSSAKKSGTGLYKGLLPSFYCWWVSPL